MLTLTEKQGFVPQDQRFKKRLAIEDTSNYKIVRRFDLAFNPYLLWAGAVAQNTICDLGVVSPLYPTFRVRGDVDPRYVGHLLLSPYIIKLYDGIAFGSVPRRRRTSVRDFLALSVPDLPHIGEQRRIASVLDAVDGIRMKDRDLIRHVGELRDAIMERILVQGSQADPPTWQKVTLGDIGDVQAGLQVAASRRSNPIPVPYLRVANAYRGRVDLSEVKTLKVTPAELERTRLKVDDLLVVEGHGNPSEIGRVARWSGGIDPCVHQNHLIRVRLDPAKAQSAYVEAYLNSSSGRQTLLRSARTTSGLNTISTRDVKAAPVLLPPVQVQKAFVSQVQRLEHLRGITDNRVSKLDELFASLQQRAFRGER